MATTPDEIKPPKCSYDFGGRPCQLTSDREGLHTYNDRLYCALHLPLGSADKPNANFDGYLNNQLSLGRTELDGVQFGGAPVNLTPANAELTLRRCFFADGASISTNAAGTTFEDCNFEGAVTFTIGGRQLRVRAAFNRRATVSSNADAELVDFSQCTFAAGLLVNLNNRVHSGSWQFRRVVFGGPLQFYNFKNCLSQNTSFVGARFNRAACPSTSEAHYRDLRLEFDAHSDRESEGLFYAIEKRCGRFALPHLSLARPISCAYDWVSEYGRSYERALLWFLGIQVAMLTTYGAMSGSVHLGAPFDGPRLRQLVAFTLAQIAKPFELLANRKPEGAATIMGDCWSADWALVTFGHSVVSIAALALLILALRWRFRRA